MPNQWKQFSGAWTPTQQLQARGANTWPAVPGAPTIGTATAGNTEATVPFTAPADTGYPTTITQYTVTSSPGSITATGSSSPITVTGLTNDTAYTFTVTATNDTGTGPASAASNSVTPVVTAGIYAWGMNQDGQLGLNDLVARSSPTQIGTATNWQYVNSQYQFVAAIKTDGTLWTWGYNFYGGLGHNDRANRSSPVQVGALTTWSQVRAGPAVIAVKTDGTLWGWGRHTQNGLGDSSDPRSSPIQIGVATNWVSVAVGPGIDSSAFAINSSNEAYVWGGGRRGQRGDNSWEPEWKYTPAQLGALTNWEIIDCGKESVYSVKTDGTLWAWGDGTSGQLPINSTVNRSSPVQVGSLTTWLRPFGGYTAQGFAIKTDNTLWAWGDGDKGELGNNQSVSVRISSPIQIGTGGWSWIGAGQENIYGIENE